MTEENARMKNVVLGAALVFAAAVPAQAQMAWTDRGYANLNGLLQTASRDVSASGSFDLYEEVATFDAPREIGSGMVVDLSGGYKVWRNLAIGLGYSRFSNTDNVTVTARIPDPIVFDSPNEQTLSAGDLEHSESAVHLSAVWFYPVTDKIDVAFLAGPSFFTVKETHVTAVTVQSNTSIVSGVSVGNAKESGTGLHAGVDVTYLVTPRIGAGVLLRYAGASVDLPGAEDIGVGGFQLGVGVRVRF
jgi:Outer membrane protein beta-barrel domain